MHKTYAQLKGLSLLEFEGFGFVLLYLCLESKGEDGSCMCSDLYNIWEDLGCDIEYEEDANVREYYNLINNFGCGEDGFSDGDCICYPIDLVLENETDA